MCSHVTVHLNITKLEVILERISCFEMSIAQVDMAYWQQDEDKYSGLLVWEFSLDVPYIRHKKGPGLRRVKRVWFHLR